MAKIDYMNIQAYLQDDSTNFQWGLHSFAEAFQHFSIRPKIDTLCAYLHKLDLPDGPVHNSSRLRTDDNDDYYDDEYAIFSRSYISKRSRKSKNKLFHINLVESLPANNNINRKNKK